MLITHVTRKFVEQNVQAKPIQIDVARPPSQGKYFIYVLNCFLLLVDYLKLYINYFLCAGFSIHTGIMLLFIAFIIKVMKTESKVKLKAQVCGYLATEAIELENIDPHITLAQLKQQYFDNSLSNLFTGGDPDISQYKREFSHLLSKKKGKICGGSAEEMNGMRVEEMRKMLRITNKEGKEEDDNSVIWIAYKFHTQV